MRHRRLNSSGLGLEPEYSTVRAYFIIQIEGLSKRQVAILQGWKIGFAIHFFKSLLTGFQDSIFTLVHDYLFLKTSPIKYACCLVLTIRNAMGVGAAAAGKLLLQAGGGDLEKR